MTIPVTLLSGFLGSGKTTLLKYILEHSDKKIAVIVNDMAELNIDAKYVKNIAQTEEKFVEMTNGCICCTLREDLLLEIKRISEAKQFDYIVIESTGVSEPMQVAETFAMDIPMNGEDETMEEKDETMEEKDETMEEKDETMEEAAENEEAQNEFVSLKGLAALDTCVTVLDVARFGDHLESIKQLKAEFLNVGEEDDRSIATLFVDQIEFANVILLNKVDLVSEEDLRLVEGMIKSLNPEAKLYKTTYSKISLDKILDTKLFDLEKAAMSAGWLKSLLSGPQSEIEEYGIHSFVYRRRKPLHPERLNNLLNSEYFTNAKSPIFRAKGYMWIAGMLFDDMIEWEQAGKHFEMRSNGPFFAATPELLENLPADVRKRIQSDFEGEFGDRRQELVFIGTKEMIDEEITKKLDECLLLDDEMKDATTLPVPSNWEGLHPVEEEEEQQ